MLSIEMGFDTGADEAVKIPLGSEALLWIAL